ncbi:MAG: hypothetical protein ACE5IR_00465 [bacterium]
MKKRLCFVGFLCFYLATRNLSAQVVEPIETPEPEMSEQVLTQKGYDKTAPAVVKLVSDEGKRIGAGVILGIHKADEKKQDDVDLGFILTSYSMVAGRDKLAVILKDFPDPLLGHIVDKWIDFDSDLAIIAIKNFPAGQSTITLGKKKTVQPEDMFTVIAHSQDGDWKPLAIGLSESDESHVSFLAEDFTGIEGAPILDKKGNMLAMVVTEGDPDENLTLAVKTNTIKPIIKEWFKSIKLDKKWGQQGLVFGSWIWAVGGGVLGSSVITAIAVSGGGDGSPKGLPRPPLPPN